MQVAAFKQAERTEVNTMIDLRVRNLSKAKLERAQDARYCTCRKGPVGFMLQCELCKDWFHSEYMLRHSLPEVARHCLAHFKTTLQGVVVCLVDNHFVCANYPFVRCLCVHSASHVSRHVRPVAKGREPEEQEQHGGAGAGGARPQVPVPAVSAVAAPAARDDPVAARVAAEAAGAAARGRGAAVPHGARHGLAGQGQVRTRSDPPWRHEKLEGGGSQIAAWCSCSGSTPHSVRCIVKHTADVVLKQHVNRVCTGGIWTHFTRATFQTSVGDGRTGVGSGEAERAESADGGAGGAREDGEDHPRRAAEGGVQPGAAGTPAERAALRLHRQRKHGSVRQGDARAPSKIAPERKVAHKFKRRATTFAVIRVSLKQW